MRRRTLSQAALVTLLLVAATTTAYARVAGFGFVSYDDPEYVAANARVTRGLSAEGLRWALTGVHHGNWHPLTTLSYMLECTLFGVDPGAQHGTNVALHVTSTVLLFLLLLRTTGAVWRSGAVAALFALHPLHVESVAWISERKDVLSAALALASAHAYVGWTRAPGVGRYGLVLVLFCLGLMSKPMLVTWPFALLLLDVWPLGRIGPGTRGVGRALLEKAPMLALSGISIALTVWAQRAGGALRSTPLQPLETRGANALVSYVAYLKRAIWPADLAVLYPYPEHFAAWQVLGSAGLLAAVTWGCFRLRRSHPYLLVGWLFYLGTLVPVIGIVQVGAQASADRYTYLPLVGIFFALVWGVGDLLERRPPLRPAAAVLTCAALATFALVTARQVSVWEDSISLYRNALRVTQRNAVVYNNLGIALSDAGRYEEAIRVYAEGLAFPSPFVHRLHYNAGLALARTGRHREALVQFDRALRIDPASAEALFHRAAALEALGRLAEARRDLERVVELSPDAADPHAELGVVLGKLGDLAGAKRHLARAIEIQPLQLDARINLAIAQLKSGDAEAAVRGLETVLRLDPGHEAARRYLQQARGNGSRPE